MSQRYYKKGRHSQGRGSPWADGPRSQAPYHASSSSGNESVHSNPHVAHALGTLIGCLVEVATVSGVVYEGIFRAISPNMDIALSVAHDKSKVPSMENVQKILEFKFSEVVKVSARTDSSSTSKSSDIFKTDTEISRSNGPASDRELEPFMDFEESSVGLEEESSLGWSPEAMFSTNKEKFQVKTKYDEKMSEYTTELDPKSEGYQERAARAKLLATEIEGKSKHGFDDVGTEEEQFSSVTRDHEEAPPPHPTPCTTTHLHTSSQTTTSTLRPHTENVPSATENSKPVTNDQPVQTTTTDDPPQSDVVTETASTSDLSSTCKDDIEGRSLASTSSKNSVDEVDCKEQVGVVDSVCAESAPVKEVEVKVEESKLLEEVPAGCSKTPPISKNTPSDEVLPTSSDSSKDKENEKPAVQKSPFKLNPNAKVFKLSTAAPAVITSTPVSTPGHSVTTASQSSSHSTPSGRRGPYKPRPPRTVTPTQNVYAASDYVLQAQAGGFMIPQGGGVGVVRPGQFVSPGSQVLYPAPYQLPTVQPGVLGAGGVYPSHLQQVVTSGVTGVTPNPQVLLAPQQLFQQQAVLSQQQGLFQQPGALGGQLQQGGTVMPTAVGLPGNASQGQHYQQVIYSPQGGQVYVSPQVGMPTQGGATPIVVSGTPLHSSVPPQPLISGVNPSQPPVFTPNRASYPPHMPGQ